MVYSFWHAHRFWWKLRRYETGLTSVGFHNDVDGGQRSLFRHAEPHDGFVSPTWCLCRHSAVNPTPIKGSGAGLQVPCYKHWANLCQSHARSKGLNHHLSSSLVQRAKQCYAYLKDFVCAKVHDLVKLVDSCWKWHTKVESDSDTHLLFHFYYETGTYYIEATFLALFRRFSSLSFYWWFIV